MRLSQKRKEELVSFLQERIKTAEEYYREHIEPEILTAYRRYKGDEDFYREKLGRLGELSKVTSSDISDKIEWAMPSLMRIFFGSDEVITVKGRTLEDDRAAELLQTLVNFQLQRQNNAFMVFYRWFKDALKYKIGVVKATWERSTEDETVEVLVSPLRYEEILNDSDRLLEEIEDEKLRKVFEVRIEEATYDEDIDAYRLKLRLRRLVSNRPKVENVLPFELIFTPDARNLHECSFVAHRKKVKADYLLRKEREGVFKNVRKALEGALSETAKTELERELYGDAELEATPSVEGLREVYLYECYTKYDIDRDGLLEDVIVWYVNGEILRIEENIYGRPPFFALTPIIESETILGKSFDDLIGQLQDLKTALLKLLMINATKVSNPKIFFDSTVIDPDTMKDNEVLQAIPLNLKNRNIQQVIQFEPVQSIAGAVLPLLEYIETMIENRTGITRYNQGLDARSLNKTASGISMIMQAANQRLELIARIFAETGVRDLFRFLVELNQRFIDQATVIRLTNKSVEIKPDDLKGEFDFVVNAGIGAGTKEQEMQFAQMLLQIVQQAVQQGVAGPVELFNAYKKVIEQLGFKNVGDFLRNPEEALNGQGLGQEGGGMQGLPSALVQALQGGSLQGMGELLPGGMGEDQG